MNENLNQNTRMTGPRQPQSGLAARVLNIEVATQQQWVTTTGSPGPEIVLGSVLSDVAGKLESIQASAFVHDSDGTNFRCKLVTEISYDGLTWAGSEDILTDFTSTCPSKGDYKIGTSKTDPTKFGRHVRFVLKYWSNTPGNTALATLSMNVSVTIIGQ